MEHPDPVAAQPKFTIATVTYNAAALIERTIQSVEAQNYSAIEHLIVDGNSHDDTLAHVHHYQERNSRAAIRHEIVCCSEPDDGLYDAMNKAINMATGQYILFLNAGDALAAPDTLECVAQAIMKARHSSRQEVWPAVAYGDTLLVDNAGSVLGPRRLRPPHHLTWRSFKNGMLVCHQAFFANTTLARLYHYDSRYRYSADFDWCIRIMRHAARHHLPIVNAECVIAHYLNAGLTTRHHKASLKERFRIMVRHYGWVTTLFKHAQFALRNPKRKL